MKKWIRWPGFIAFVAVAALATIFWLFLVDQIVRRVVERAGTAAAGAEVDVSRAGLTLSPFGITLSGIQVTDPENPSQNSIEIKRIAFSLDGLNILRRKVIIQEMSAEGLRFNTARKRPGRVAAPVEKKAETQKPSGSSLPSFAVPDVKKILATETFGSVKQIDDAKARVQKTTDDWQKRIAELPNKAAMDAYRSRIDKLKVSSKSGVKDLAAAARDAKKIKDDLDRDLDKVKTSRSALGADLASAKDLVAKAEQGQLDEVRRIRDKYSISPAGLGNMSRVLFGDKIASWFDTGLLWYNRIAPLVSGSADKKGSIKVSKPLRGKGVDVKFPEHHPLPDFLIRIVKASLQPDAGTFSGTIKDITPDQDIINAPLTFRFDGSNMQDVRALAMSGSLDHIRPAAIKDTISIKADGWSAKNLGLSSSPDLPISLEGGLIDLEVNGLRGPNGLKAQLVARFRSVRINTGGAEGGNVLLASLRGSLSKVSAFSLNADITGEPGNYDVKISSDLDRVFKDAIGRVVQEQSNKLEQELKAAVQAKTGEKLKDLKASLGGLNSLGGKVDGVQNQLNGLLQETSQKSGGGKARLPF